MGRDGFLLLDPGFVGFIDSVQVSKLRVLIG